MKKCDFKQLALTGLTSAFLLASQANAAESVQNQTNGTLLSAGCGNGSQGGCNASHPRGNSSRENYTADNQNSQKTTISESDFLSQLDAEGRNLYQSLDADGKKLARDLFSSGQYTDKKEAVKAAAKKAR